MVRRTDPTFDPPTELPRGMDADLTVLRTARPDAIATPEWHE
ncbi:MAG: hypothetical protein ACRDSZ_25615 [Pseudonocardiaceae bacterium]